MRFEMSKLLAICSNRERERERQTIKSNWKLNCSNWREREGARASEIEQAASC